MTNGDLTTPHRNGLLFLCVENAARSQMAEAFARFIGPADIQYYSAGSRPRLNVDPLAVKAMREVGLDLSKHKTKAMDAIPMETIATVITLCEGECPSLPEGVHHLSWPLPDPGATMGEEEEMLQAFRRVRDQIRELVSRLF